MENGSNSYYNSHFINAYQQAQFYNEIIAAQGMSSNPINESSEINYPTNANEDINNYDYEMMNMLMPMNMMGLQIPDQMVYPSSQPYYEVRRPNSKPKKRSKWDTAEPTPVKSEDADPPKTSSDETTEKPSVPEAPHLMDTELMSAAEVKRQIHIQSEQKRRAQIRDGFEELRQHLPPQLGGPSLANDINPPTKLPSKAAILTRTVLYLQHLKSTINSMYQEIERLRAENDQLRNLNENVMFTSDLDVNGSIMEQSGLNRALFNTKSSLNSVYALGL